VVFWTRHPRPFLTRGPLHRLVTREIDNPVINLTVTGLGGTALEPGTPGTDEAIAALPDLVQAFRGEPWRVRWRFDPLLRDHTRVEDFQRIGEAMSRLGVPTCTFSFPAYRSLKGDLTPGFERAWIPRWTEAGKSEMLSRIAEIAGPLGIQLLSCNQPENTALHPAVAQAQCVPAEVLERGHPDGEPLQLGKDRSQRSKCNCVASDDIGDYELDRCGGGCVYCYSKAGGPL
jgi:hypothetical protein